jgi:hypothetical protein
VRARRSILAGVVGLVATGTVGCYTQTTWFYPAPGQGSMVTNGDRLGVAKRLSGEDPAAQSFVVTSVRQAYIAAADGNQRRTIVQVTANVVNKAPAPARFETGKARLEVAGRAFAPRWTWRSPGATGPDREEVAPGAHVRFDLFFDLEPYAPGPYAVAPPTSGGIPLASLKEFQVSWQAEWAGDTQTGRFRFVRDHTGRVGAGWRVAPGLYWGYSWWGWPYAWPTGVIVHQVFHPWRHHGGHFGGHHHRRTKRPGTTIKRRPKIRLK